jgi:hypothetical protein
MERLSGRGATTFGARARRSRWKKALCGCREPLFVSIEPLSRPKMRAYRRKSVAARCRVRLSAGGETTEGHTTTLFVSAGSKFVLTKSKNVSTKTLPVHAGSTDAPVERLCGTLGRTEPSPEPRDVSRGRLDVSMERLDGPAMPLEEEENGPPGRAERRLARCGSTQPANGRPHRPIVP